MSILQEAKQRAKLKGFVAFQEGLDGFSCLKRGGFAVIMSIAKEQDNKLWAHVSMSYQNRIPSYLEVKNIKEIFIGKDKKAIQVFPEEKEHINIMPYCLHLWCCLEDDSLPDFTRGLGMI